MADSRTLMVIPEDERKLCYMAGLIDGEGHIGIRRYMTKDSKSPSHQATLTIANTDVGLMLWLLDNFGGSVHEQKLKAEWKEVFRWNVGGSNVPRLLEVVLPYLVVKQRQAELVIEFSKTEKHKWKGRQLDPAIVTERDGFYDEIKLLNKRGVAA